MKSYSIEVNKNDYRKLKFTEDYSATDKLPLENERRITNWAPPSCRFVDEGKPMPDFLMLGTDAIVYNDRTIDQDCAPEYDGQRELLTLLEMACYGEKAHVEVQCKQRFSVLLVTECCNALDKEKSHWQTDAAGRPTTIDNFEFHESRVFSESGLFRLADPDFERGYIFAYTARDDEEEKFLERYTGCNKTRLVFTEVWSA